MIPKNDTLKTTDFDAIRLRVASPEVIRSWSHGEVMKPETINYRTQKPEKSGLFAEEIFGPSKDWECYCGKYKKIRYKGIVCDKCGVEVTRAIVRRERMGHIELAAPVSHIWFLRGIPSKIGTVLNMSVQSIEKVIYFANFIVTDVNEEAREQTLEQVRSEYDSKKKMIEGEYKRDAGRVPQKFPTDDKAQKKELASLEEIRDNKMAELEEDFLEVEKELKTMKIMQIISEATFHDWSLRYGHVFEAMIGAEAIYNIFKKIDLQKLLDSLETSYVKAGKGEREKLNKRITLIR